MKAGTDVTGNPGYKVPEKCRNVKNGSISEKSRQHSLESNSIKQNLFFCRAFRKHNRLMRSI
jgi:hypothetical protein